MAAIAYRPDRAASNPPRDVSMNVGLRGRVLRLEAPEELNEAAWDGPVYAILEGEPKHLQTTDRSPFVQDEGVRVPAWQCKIVSAFRAGVDAVASQDAATNADDVVWIPYWRFTQPHRDLARELQERPLLSVFRFARVARYFMAAPDDDTKLTLRTPGTYSCCQVLTYRPASSVSLVDEIGVIIEPGSVYVCIVALRRHVVDDPVIVAVPLPEVTACMIPAVEFMLGYGHGTAVSIAVPPFATGWTAFKANAPSDPLSTRAHLVSSFAAAGVLGISIDTGISAVPYVSAQGAIMNQVPVDFVLQLTRPRGTVADGGDMSDDEPQARAPLGGPLLQRADVVLTPVSIVALEARAPSTASLPTATSNASATGTATATTSAPGAAPTSIPGLSTTEQFLFAMLQEQRDENRRRHDATERQFTTLTSQMTQFAQAVANIQQQVSDSRRILPPQPVLQLDSVPSSAAVSRPPSTSAPRTPVRATDVEPMQQRPIAAAAADQTAHPQRRTRTGETYDADSDDINPFVAALLT